MSAVGRQRVQTGEIAAICACALLSRLDWEQPLHEILLERALLIERRLPRESGLIAGARFTELAFKLHDYAAACAARRTTPTGERDERALIHLQGDLRARVDRCLEVLGDRCFAAWSGAGGAEAPSIDDRAPAGADDGPAEGAA